MQKQLLIIIFFFSLFYTSHAQNASVYTYTTKINVGPGSVVVMPANVSVNGPSYIVNNGKAYIAGNFTNNGNLLSTGGTGETHFNGTSILSGSAAYTPFYDLFVDAGSSLSVGSSVISITGTGSFNNNSTFNAGTGKVVFLGQASISGTTTFNNIDLGNGVVAGGAVDFGKFSTVNGTLTVNNGGSATGASSRLVIYTPSSSLVYNTPSLTTGNEWFDGAAGTRTPGAGVPQDVTINTGIITIPNSGGSNRTLAGNLLIKPGTTLQMTSGGSRDLYIIGNWTNTGNFIPNGRTVIFNAKGVSGSPVTQTISGTTTFYNLTFGNSFQTTDFSNSNVTVTNQFYNDAGTMNDGTSTVVLNGATGTIIGAAAKNFYDLQISSGANILHTTGGGNIHIANSFLNNGALTEDNSYNFFFDSSGATNQTMSGTGTTLFGSLTIGGSGTSNPTTLNCSADFTIAGSTMRFNRSSIYNGVNNTATFSTNSAAVNGTGTANFYNLTTNVQLNVGTFSKVFNNLTLNSGGFLINRAPIYGPLATLIYNTNTPSLATSWEWNSSSITPGLGVPKNVIIQNTNNIQLAGDRSLTGDINISAIDTLNLSTSTLTVNGAFTNTGWLSGGINAGLAVGSSVNHGTVYFRRGLPFNQLRTLAVNGGTLTLAGSSATLDTLNIVSGNPTEGYGTVTADGTLNTNGILTLRSNKSGTARIGQSAGSIIGDVLVERYIGAHRAWRYLTAPVSSSQTINAAWQEGQANASLGVNSNNNFGYGMHISGGSYGDGFDANTTGNPSILTWYEQSQDWTYTAPATNNTRLDAYPGYYTFVRGSRAVNMSLGQNAPADSTKLRAKGGVSLGSVIKNLSVTQTGNLALVGNPYASSINLKNVLTNANTLNVNKNKFYVYDPLLTDDYGVGGVVTYSNGVMVPAGGSPSYPNADSVKIIQSGQAFLVQLENITGTINFLENNKTTGEANVFGFRTQSPKPDPKVYINLNLPAGGDSLLLIDGVAAVFDNKYSDSVDFNDALKLGNVYEDMSLIRYGKALAIETRPIPEKTDTLFLNIGNVLSQPYVLQTLPEAVPPSVKEAWLIDNYLKTQTPLNTTTESRYTFNTTGDAASYVNRFMIVFTVERKNETSAPIAKSSSTQKKETAGTVTVTPNPVTGRQNAQLRFSNMVKGDYEIEMYNSAGRKMLVRSVSHAGGNNTYPLTLNAGWAADKYNIVVVNKESHEVITIPLIISR